MVRIVTRATERCAFCQLGDGYNEVFQAWAQGDLTPDEVGSHVGLTGSARSKHLSRAPVTIE